MYELQVRYKNTSDNLVKAPNISRLLETNETSKPGPRNVNAKNSGQLKRVRRARDSLIIVTFSRVGWLKEITWALAAWM